MIYLNLLANFDFPKDISFEELVLNWELQTPHWHYLTNEGINFFKGTKNKIYKKDK